MINILSYVGMNMQSEVCLWALLGLMRTIFDATLFKVNANLKQVWQMTMPDELSMPVQRVLRTMISGVMLVQCFTVYVYLASYIVLLYPIFLEERPTLVLPWLLLAAIRKLLCELTSLALGLGTCVLLGPARPPCIKFVIEKVTSISPAFYMWMLVFSYYRALKVASAFKTFPAVLPDHDYGLELAVRRRRTKSLLGEEQLRRKLIANFYGDRNSGANGERSSLGKIERSSRMVHSTDTSIEDIKLEVEKFNPLAFPSYQISDTFAYEDWLGYDVTVPRDTDRIVEQFVLMLLRIGIHLNEEGTSKTENCNSPSFTMLPKRQNPSCPTLPADVADTPPCTPPIVGSSKGSTASYLQEYPQIFMKKATDITPFEHKIGSIRTVESLNEREEGVNTVKSHKRVVAITSKEKITLDIEKVTRQRISTVSDKNGARKESVDKISIPQHSKFKENTNSKPRQSNSKEINFKPRSKQKDQPNPTNNIASTSKASIHSIINKVKNRFAESKNSFKENKINIETDGATSSHDPDNPQVTALSNIKTHTNKDKSASQTNNNRKDA